MLTGANERVTGKLEKAGLIELLGRDNFCRDLPHALATLAADPSRPAAAGPSPGGG